MKLSNRLELLVQRLNTQDNRATAHPIFLVQQEHRIYGMDPDYTDKCVWEPSWAADCYYDSLEDAMMQYDYIDVTLDDVIQAMDINEMSFLLNEVWGAEK